MSNFCKYIGCIPPKPIEGFDGPELDAYTAGSQMERHMNEALKCALAIDHYQAVYSDLQGTYEPNPFNALRVAISEAEKVAVSDGEFNFD